jgi:DhnA family fructose-bisphosphate aldolase class Ia
VYHYLAGSDASRSLRIMGADIIKQKYPIVGIIEK